MRTCSLALAFAALLFAGTATWTTDAAVRYPLTLVLDAQVTSGVSTLTSKVTIQIDRAMDDPVRTRVTDALKFGGYANFLNALRPVQPIGSIRTQTASVDIKYTREEQDGTGSRLVVAADKPLFFLGGDPAKGKVGFELTMVDLRFDGKGGVSGQMAGAARVRPAPDGSVLLDTYAEELVQLKGQVTQQ